jgi:SprB repeat
MSNMLVHCFFYANYAIKITRVSQPGCFGAPSGIPFSYSLLYNACSAPQFALSETTVLKAGRIFKSLRHKRLHCLRQKRNYTVAFAICICLCIQFCGNIVLAQNAAMGAPQSTSGYKPSAQSFIQNIGQYGTTVKGQEAMGAIQFAYEDLGMPVLFTPKGLIHLQRKVEKISHAEEERMEEMGIPEPEIERKRNITDRVITMEWLNANPAAEIVAEQKTSFYYTYRMLHDKAYGYKKITYKNIYPGIDLVYNFINNSKNGFEYSLLVQPGADISVVKLKYGGDVKNITTNARGYLIINSDIDGISSSIPVSYYGAGLMNKTTGDLKSAYKITSNEIGFVFPQGYDNTKAIVIDPFVTTTGNLAGLNAGKAKDVDFDYAGNIYVTGGGAYTGNHSLAKFDASGALQWTFNGALAIPTWTFGTYYGGWMVEKPTGNIYLGQGFQPSTGFRVIRINTTGLYDNYITTANASFMEAWKMFWSCNNGSPQILIAGGGLNSNINFGVFTPPATTVTGLNITGVPYAGGSGWAQDIADFVFDPVSNEMYSIFGSTFGTPSVNNKIYKNTAPYSAASVAWNVPSGYTTIQEAANRPYLTAGGLNDNSANMLCVNASYLYYWDGKNLKAFNKTTGAGAGTPVTTANIPFMQGGIIADACNNIFVGEANGIIKVYQFNGITFSDAPADIVIPGFAGKAVYDLAYDESKKLLYASGDGFVTSVDVSAYCPATLYTINVVPNCIAASATATISPAPPAGSVITYTLFNGSIPIATNTTGIFTGLSPNITYTIVATINLSCSGSQASTTFVIPGPAIATSIINTTCGNSTGIITASGSVTTAPYAYSIDGTNFQASGIFNGLAAGVYTVTVQDANGCKSTATVTILNTNGPVLTYTSTNANCGNNNGTITANATGGTAPYTYSINGTTYQSSNFFTGLVGGTYTLTVKDANGCTNAVVVTITSSPAPQLTAIPATATCGSNNGNITAFGSSGTAPLQYSINGNIYQAGNVFTNLTPGVYAVTVKDANGCMATVSVTIPNSAAPTVSAISTAAACNNVNGTITASGNGGIAPLQYSINGITFQAGNIFTGLAAGAYTVTVKDATGCTNVVNVTIANANAPVLTAVSTASACTVNNGSVTATASAGTPAYQYSINGITYQASNIFNGLAPGNYIVYVRDGGGCIATFAINVPATAGPAITATVTATACGANTGTITANGSGGTAPLQYSIDGITYQAGNVFNGLATGIYTVYVKDATGCIKTTVVTITNTSGLTLNGSSISSACSGNTGTITATATGGIAPLQYSIDGTTYQPVNIFTGVPPGVYTLYVRDANNCIVTKQVTVTASSGPSLTVTTLFQATCGGNNGVVKANGAGGTPPLTYSLDGGAFQPAQFFISLNVGVHTITVRDANNCTAIQTFTITNVGAGTPPTDVTFVVRNALPCTGGNGRIKNLKGEPSGGGLKYIFSLDGGPFTTANQFTNVPPGVHTVTAQNESFCNITKLVTIGSGTPATATATSTASACGANTGTITITGVGANTPYHASIDNGATWVTFFPPGANSFTFNGLAPGTYNIQIADDADYTVGDPGLCISIISVVVPSTGGPLVTATQVNPACTAASGSITATGAAGVPPYNYSINGGAYTANNVFNNLTPGVYAISVQDGTGCTNGITVTLTGQAVPTVTATLLPASCNLNNGTITATGSGGVAPLEYSLNGTVFQASNIFTNLSPGTYTLYVKDVNNCYSSTNIIINNIVLPKVTAFTIAATCNNTDGSIIATGTFGTAPYLFSIDGIVYQSSGTFQNLAAGFYTVYIKDDRGCITTTGINVANITAPFINNIATTAASCSNAAGTITVTATGGVAPLQFSIDGISFQAANIFTALLPGTYTVTVKDVNGCLSTRSAVVANTSGPQVLTAVIVHAACGLNNGTITATASGGTGALQYSINGTVYQASNVFNAVAAGAYTLYVKDVNGCIKTLALTVLNLPAPLLLAASSPASCGLSDGTITASATGGTGILTYSKDGVIFQSSNIFLNLAAGPYIITVKDARGCTATFNITVNTAGASVLPAFNAVAPICSGAVLAPLPATSLNGITGAWAPALNNTSTTTYTFTPNAGQCAVTTTLTIVVNPNVAPLFNAVAPICSGAVLAALPTTSLNGITGVWAPALNNTTTTTYTFTPTAGLCASIQTLTITVNPKPAPVIYHN